MKRTDLIGKIVYEALSWQGLDTSGVPLEEIANDVLKVCEKAGMLPPRAQVMKRSVIHDDNGEVMYDEMISVPAYEWEPENEEK